jgi:hypothetical protein
MDCSSFLPADSTASLCKNRSRMFSEAQLLHREKQLMSIPTIDLSSPTCRICLVLRVRHTKYINSFDTKGHGFSLSRSNTRWSMGKLLKDMAHCHYPNFRSKAHIQHIDLVETNSDQLTRASLTIRGNLVKAKLVHEPRFVGFWESYPNVPRRHLHIKDTSNRRGHVHNVSLNELCLCTSAEVGLFCLPLLRCDDTCVCIEGTGEGPVMRSGSLVIESVAIARARECVYALHRVQCRA